MKVEYSKYFSVDNSIAFADLCRLSYLEEVEIVKQLKGYNQFKFFSIGETQFFVAGNDDHIVTVFRGSQSAGDWAIDFNFDLIPAGLLGGIFPVHEGFYTESVSVAETLLDCVNKFKTLDQKVYLAGHSLGAALAGMMSAVLESTGIGFDQAYCYGMPRIGHTSFADKFNKLYGHKLYRIVNHNDMVTRVPFRAMGFGHIGRLAYIDSASGIQFDASFWTRFLERFKFSKETSAGLVTGGIADHAIELYIEGLMRNV